MEWLIFFILLAIFGSKKKESKSDDEYTYRRQSDDCRHDWQDSLTAMKRQKYGLGQMCSKCKAMR